MRGQCLVTGGAGFIGSHLVERLLTEGRPVRVVDNLSTGKWENLAPFEGRFDMVEGDISDPAIAAKACRGVECVLHEAAIPSVPKSVADPLSSHRANIEGTFNMLMAAREAGVRRFVYAASSSAYGETETLPKVETMATSPLSPYAVQKLTGEYYCTAFARCYGLETLSIRYFNVFGPRQDPKSQYAAAIPAFVTAILRGESPTVYGDGEQTRDFTYIDNVIHANMLALDAPKTGGEVINVATGEHITVNAVIDEINKLLGRHVEASYVKARAGDIKHSWAAIGRAKEVIGYEPVVLFGEGLRRAIEWYAANLQETAGGCARG